MDLLANEYAVFFLIVALGLILGNIKIRGISLESSGVIFVALAFGHYGFKTPQLLQNIGLVLFIYSVGIAAGPGFFKSFKEQGLQFIALAAVIVFSAGGLALGLAKLTNIDTRLAVGLFTGALTSTPGLATAIEASKSPLASIGYGISYPFGVLGVILFVRLINKVVRINIADSEKEYESGLKAENPNIFNKNYKVTNPNIFNKTLGDLQIRAMTDTNISRVFHNGVTSTPLPSTILHEGDIIKAVGSLDGLDKVKILIGEETDIKIPLSKDYTVTSILVSNSQIANKTLADIQLFANHEATATRIRRAGIDITPKATTKLQLGDKVMIACPKSNLEEVELLFGHTSRPFQLDLLPISIGIILGLILGQITIPIAGLNISLGVTGGVLFSSLLLSKIGRTGPILWNIAGEVNAFLRKIGLVFFLVGVGTNAGEQLYSTISNNGIELFYLGAIITVVPMIIAAIFARLVLKMNFLLFLGALTGGMTSTPALSAIDSMTESEAPKIGYATIYPFALVFMIICSQILCLF